MAPLSSGLFLWKAATSGVTDWKALRETSGAERLIALPCHMEGSALSGDILPFLRGSSFDAAATKAMGEAYDKARQMLHDKGQPAVVQEIIAKRIIELANSGLRDPDVLAERALLALGIKKE